MIGIALLGDAVERIAVGFPLLLGAGLVFGADLLLADQDALSEPQVGRIETRIVLDDGLDRDFVLVRNGVQVWESKVLRSFRSDLGSGTAVTKGILTFSPAFSPLPADGLY